MKNEIMKKEFSFYEFVGILVPGVMILFFGAISYEDITGKSIVDFSKFGESLIFIIVAYGTGHILHSIGNLYESIFWELFGGMPTQWLIKKNRFGKFLFSKTQREAILSKIKNQFGDSLEKDYGMDVYNWLSLKKEVTVKRIDVFNANYSLLRGMAVTFYLLTISSMFFFSWKVVLAALVLGLLSNYRMYRFAKIHAIEIYRTYFNYE